MKAPTPEREASTIRSKLRHDAIKRDMRMTLSVADIIELRIGKACHYCLGKLKCRVPSLDRIDNARGYHADNVVPCCSMCNWARGGLLAYDEFCAAMRVRVAKHGCGKAWPERPERERRIESLRLLGVEEAKLAERVGGVFAARRIARKRAISLRPSTSERASHLSSLDVAK